MGAKLLALFTELARIELKTDAGRMNSRSMVGSLVLVALVTITPVFEAIVRVFKDSYTSGFPVVEVVGMWFAFCVICVLLLGMLERGRPK